MVSGQVYNPVAISYVPRRDLSWYLEKAGGATHAGDKKHNYVLRVDGSVVVPREAGSIWMSGGFRNVRMQPGDTIFVPEKIVGGSPVWQDIIGVAQIASSVAILGAVAGAF
jgi:protein involved in polysaccharide export with SLBB domain